MALASWFSTCAIVQPLLDLPAERRKGNGCAYVLLAGDAEDVGVEVGGVVHEGQWDGGLEPEARRDGLAPCAQRYLGDILGAGGRRSLRCLPLVVQGAVVSQPAL